MNNDDRLYELVAEWDIRRQHGETITAESLCEGCPELLPELQEYIASITATDWLMTDPSEEDAAESTETVLTSSQTLDQLIKCIASSGLMTHEELLEIQSRPTIQLTDAVSLAHVLIREGKLTRYQARLLCDGDCRGHILGDYIILDEIGAGGMGQVFKARHRRMKRIVALKTLPKQTVDTPQAVARFQREVEAAGMLDHQNIVTAHDAGEADGTHFLVMQYVAGQDLMDVVRNSGPLPVGQAVDYICQTAAGLVYAHSQGIIHRDIKPGNLLLDKDGRVRILDMGLARMEDINESTEFGDTQTALTNAGTMMGTVDFMSPEQALDAKDADARADVYSLGCTLYFLLTGRAPYSGKSLMARMVAHREAEIPALPDATDIPESLRDVFRRSMAKQVDDRYQTMEEFLSDLQAIEIEESQSLQQTTAAASLETQPQTSPDSIETTSVELSETIITAPEPSMSSPPVLRSETTSVETETNSGDGQSLRSNGGGRRIFAGLIALGLLGGAGWLFNQFFLKYETGNGTIEIHSNVADFQVEIDGKTDVVTIVDPDDKTKVKVKIPKGAKLLRVSKGGLEADVSEFVLKTVKGPIEVRFVPNSVASQVGPEIATADDYGDNLPRMSDYALVQHPTTLRGLRSWTVETETHRGAILAAIEIESKSLVATAGDDRVIRLWDAKTKKLNGILVGHSAPVVGVAWVADKKQLASLSSDGELISWDLPTLTPIESRAFPTRTKALRWLEGFGLAVLTDHKLFIRNLSNDEWEVVHSFKNEATCLAVSSDGLQLAVGCWNGLLVRYSKQSGSQILQIDTKKNIHSLTWRNSDVIYFVNSEPGGEIRRYSVADAQDSVLGKLDFDCFAMRPLDDDRLLCTGPNGWAAILMFPQFKRRDLDLSVSVSTSTLPSIDGEVWLCGDTGRISVFDTANFKERFSTSGMITGYDSAGGTALVGIDEDKIAIGEPTLTVWDATNALPPRFPTGSHGSNHGAYMAATPQGEWFATADNWVAIHRPNALDQDTLRVEGKTSQVEFSKNLILACPQFSKIVIRFADGQIHAVDIPPDWGAVNVVKWASEVLVIGCENRLAAWDPATKEILFSADSKCINSLAWSTELEQMAVATPLTVIVSREIRTGKFEHLLDLKPEEKLVGWVEESQAMLFTDANDQFFVIRPEQGTRQPMADLPPCNTTPTLLFDSTMLGYYDRHDGCARLWTVGSYKSSHTAYGNGATYFCVSPDGNYRRSADVNFSVIVDDGAKRRMLTPLMFLSEFGWKNEPAKAVVRQGVSQPSIAEIQSHTDREAAEFVLQHSGSVIVRIESDEFEILDSKELPSEPFALVQVGATETTLKSLKTLSDLARVEIAEIRGAVNDIGWAASLPNLTHIWMRGAVSEQAKQQLAKIPNLKHLNFSQSVTDETLEGLPPLPHLEELDLLNSSISDVGLKNISSLTGLKYLRLAGSHSISDAGLRHLSSLASLERLDLDLTNITGTGFEHLKGIRLYYVNLDGSKVDASGLRAIAATNIQILNVQNTRVADDWLTLLADNPHLRSIYLSGTDVTPSGVSKLRRALPKLLIEDDESIVCALVRKLGGNVATNAAPFSVNGVNLDKSEVSDSDLAVLATANALRFLTLNDTGITDAGLKHLSTLQIEKLQLGNCEAITSRGIANLGPQETLRQLYLFNTRINNEGVRLIREQFPKLTDLVLCGTNITRDALPHLAELKELEWLNFGKTSVTMGDTIELQKRLPNCRIVTTDSQRQVVEWVLKHKGSLTVQYGNSYGGQQIENLSDFDDRDYVVQTVSLEGVTEVDDSALDILRFAVRLTRLNVTGTNVSADGVKSIQSILPKCKIEHDH